MSQKREYAEQIINDAYTKYYVEIYRFCLSFLTKDRASVDDCVQDTFIVLYQNVLKGKEVNNVRAYLYKTAENVVHSKLREIKKHQEHINLDEVRDLPTESEEMTEKLSFDEYSRQISDALSDKEAQLFKLRYIDDLPIDVIADKMDLSFSAVGTRLHRLKKKLSVIISEMM